jgi:hypothetical protein
MCLAATPSTQAGSVADQSSFCTVCALSCCSCSELSSLRPTPNPKHTHQRRRGRRRVTRAAPSATQAGTGAVDPFIPRVHQSIHPAAAKQAPRRSAPPAHGVQRAATPLARSPRPPVNVLGKAYIEHLVRLIQHHELQGTEPQHAATGGQRPSIDWQAPP